MSAVLLPGGAVPGAEVRSPSRSRAKAKARTPAFATKNPRLALCVLLTVIALELALWLAPPSLLVLHPFQKTVLFKQLSGYSMLALMVFAVSFGGLRRLPALAGWQARLNGLHQVAGLLLLVLLALHLGQSPAGFLRYTFHAIAIGTAAGAVRNVYGRRIGRAGSNVLLAVHVALSCLVVTGALVHLYLVYAYTA